MDLRQYVKSKQAYEEGQKETDPAKRPSGAGIDRVRDITWELIRERLEEAKTE